MTTFQRLQQGNKKYLLVPVMPTPNGGLHLGHLSGPYLKMDVLARAQRRNENEVAVFFGSDAYESYMNLKSWQTGEDVDGLCNEYHERMLHDLDALKIEYDAFINPLDTSYNKDFISFISGLAASFVNKGSTKIRQENIYIQRKKIVSLPVAGSRAPARYVVVAPEAINARIAVHNTARWI